MLPYPFKYFIGCLLQILLGPFLNTLTHLQASMTFRLFCLFILKLLSQMLNGFYISVVYFDLA